jgi:hypothetical protein
MTPTDLNNFPITFTTFADNLGEGDSIKEITDTNEFDHEETRYTP